VTNQKLPVLHLVLDFPDELHLVVDDDYHSHLVDYVLVDDAMVNESYTKKREKNKYSDLQKHTIVLVIDLFAVNQAIVDVFVHFHVLLNTKLKEFI
jgi:hypothetical protein